MEKKWQFGQLMHDSRDVIRLIEEHPSLRRKIKPFDSLIQGSRNNHCSIINNYYSWEEKWI